MDISIFDVTGPVMIGPSSSHTAGAARLAYVARRIAAKPFTKVTFGLSGSFAETYRGHGTDRALVAGALGLQEDDERLADAFELAKQQGIVYEFYEKQMEGMHENSVLITFFFDEGRCEVAGSSVGGGQIVIRSIDGFETELTATAPTLVVSHYDRRGVISDVTRVLADNEINIGVMKLSRQGKGELACCTIEIDSGVSQQMLDQLCAVRNVIDIRLIELSGRGTPNV